MLCLGPENTAQLKTHTVTCCHITDIEPTVLYYSMGAQKNTQTATSTVNTHWKHTWTMVSVTGYDLSSQPLTVTSLPLWTGAVTLSSPAPNAPTT